MDRRLFTLCLASAVTLAACSEEVSPAERERIDAAKIAAVERANIVPPDPVSPQKIRYPDYEANDLFGAGCAFVPAGGGLGAIALTRADLAYLKLDEKVVRLAADKGGEKAPFATWEKYDGRIHSILLEFAPDDGKASGTETVEYPADLTIRNGRDQIVYRVSGIAQCGF
jgi:hypothetical protein